MINFVIDGFKLQDPTQGIYVTESDFYSMPKIDLNYKSLAEQDGAVLLDKRMQHKEINIKGSMIKNTQAQLDKLIDKLKSQVNKEAVDLVIDFGDKTRTYRVTIQALNVQRRRGLSIATYDLSLFSQYPFGADEIYTELVSGKVTTASESVEVFIEGNYPTSPLVNLTVNSVTNGTGGSISINNASNFIGVTVTRDWQAGDILQIDSLSKDVLVNGSQVEYTGRFPVWQAGSGVMNYTDTFSDRDVDILVTYIQQYI